MPESDCWFCCQPITTRRGAEGDDEHFCSPACHGEWMHLFGPRPERIAPTDADAYDDDAEPLTLPLR